MYLGGSMSKLEINHTRVAVGALLATVVVLAIGAAGTATAGAATTCTWAGTPAAPTGTFTISPGLTNVPSAGPLKFKATGQLAGGGRCTGTMTWVGQLDAGATCPFSSFEGKVEGLPGVARFWGKGSLLVPSILYDKNGKVVGEENAQIMTQSNLPRTTDCTKPEGFTGGWPGMFSSVFELYD
jgi:hypothetical protein